MVDVKLENINFSYKLKNKQKNIALKNINAYFEKEKIHVIIGSSGCGKTTLLKVIAGLLDEETGHIYFDDTDITHFTIGDRRISLVNQNIVLYPHMNVFNNIANPLKALKVDIKEMRVRVEEVAALLNIKDLLGRKVHQISIGQAQRVAIARAIIKRPNVYLFDEPFSNLDIQNRDELRIELKKLLSTLHATAIFVTHDIKEAMLFGDDITIMDNGQIIEKLDSKNFMQAKSQIAQELIKSGL